MIKLISGRKVAVQNTLTSLLIILIMFDEFLLRCISKFCPIKLSKILYKICERKQSYEYIGQNAQSRIEKYFLMDRFIHNTQSSYIEVACKN